MLLAITLIALSGLVSARDTASLAPPWLEIAGTTGASSFNDALTGTAAFYRLTR